MGGRSHFIRLFPSLFSGSDVILPSGLALQQKLRRYSCTGYLKYSMWHLTDLPFLGQSGCLSQRGIKTGDNSLCRQRELPPPAGTVGHLGCPGLFSSRVNSMAHRMLSPLSPSLGATACWVEAPSTRSITYLGKRSLFLQHRI